MAEPITSIAEGLPDPEDQANDLGYQYANERRSARARQAQTVLDSFLAESGQPTETPKASQERVTSSTGEPDAPGYVDAIKAGAKEALVTLPQIPTQIAGGVVDAFKDFSQTIDDVGQYALEGVLGKNEADRIIEGVRRSNPIGMVADALPDIKAPRNTGGALVRQAAEFMTAFVPVVGQFNKARSAAGLAGAASRISADAAAGFISSFVTMEPLEGALSSFVDKNPELRGPIEDFFARDESDPAAVNRLKNAFEGAGIGIMADGVLTGLRVIRAGRRARLAAKAQKPAVMEAETAITEGSTLLGDPSAPRVGRRVTAKDKLRAAEKRVAERFPAGQLSRDEIKRQAALEETSIEVNLARIEGPEDVKALYQEVTDLFAGSIGDARRNVRSNELTEAAANRLGLSVDDVLKRRKGQALNAEESVAFRKIWDDAATQVVDLANAAGGPNAGAVDQFKFRQALIKFQAISEEVLGARAETARALQSWNIKTGGPNEQGRALKQLLETAGGEKTSAELAKRIATAAAGGATPGQLSVMMRKGYAARTIDAVQESFVMGLLWTPSTHAVNTASNTLVTIQQVLERGVAARIAAERGATDSVAPGEAMAYLHGIGSALKDMWGLGGQANLARTLVKDASKIDIPQNAISSQAFELSETSGLGRAVDFFGNATRLPGVALQAEDQFFKSINFSAELHAQAHREAYRLGGSQAEIAANYARILSDPPETIRLAAADNALYTTFQDSAGAVGKWLMAGRRSFPLLTLLIPFVRTPTRILSYTFERTPMAPLVGHWKADIAAGGARADIAKARMAVGTTLMAVVSDYAYDGFITGNGPKNDAEREALMRQGWAPESVRIGDVNYPYNRTDPLGFQMSVAANLAEAVRTADIDEEDAAGASEILAAAIMATSATVTDKTYFFGVAQALDALRDPDRYGQTVLSRTAASLVPFNTLLRAISRVVNTERSAPNTVYEAIQSMIPVWESGLIRRMDLWGQPITSETAYGPAFSRLIDVASPVKPVREKTSPIDTEMTNLGIGVARIRKTTTLDGVIVNLRQYPKVYEAYVKLAGNEYKDPVFQMGAKDYLDSVVTGKNPLSQIYSLRSDGPDGGKATFIKSTVSKYRQAAQRVLLDPYGSYQGEEFDAVRDLVQKKKDKLRVATLEALQ